MYDRANTAVSRNRCPMPEPKPDLEEPSNYIKSSADIVILLEDLSIQGMGAAPGKQDVCIRRHLRQGKPLYMNLGSPKYQPLCGEAGLAG